jgi:hypothetical protein
VYSHLLHPPPAFTDCPNPFFSIEHVGHIHHSHSEAIQPAIPVASSISPSDPATILLHMRQNAPNSHAAGTELAATPVLPDEDALRAIGTAAMKTHTCTGKPRSDMARKALKRARCRQPSRLLFRLLAAPEEIRSSRPTIRCESHQIQQPSTDLAKQTCQLSRSFRSSRTVSYSLFLVLCSTDFIPSIVSVRADAMYF